MKILTKIPKGQVLTNRKEFKQTINEVRKMLNHDDSNYRNGKNRLLDYVDCIMVEYNVTQRTISQILQISSTVLGGIRRDTGRTLKDTRSNVQYLKDRIAYIHLIKLGLKTVSEIAEISGVSKRAVRSWVTNDKLYSMTMDKAIAFKHSKEC